jgi:hypothetical protein
MDDNLLGSGIKISQIANLDEYQAIIEDMICCVCMNVILNPVECTNCDTLICEDCLIIINIAGKKCVTSKCQGKMQKANKFVREILGNLQINCEYCKKTKILYKDFESHLDKVCPIYQESMREKLFNTIKKQDDTINKLQKELDSAKNIIPTADNTNIYANMSKEALRSALITFNLQVNQKMELYNSCVEGRLVDFKNLILVKKYPVLEEVSAHNYFWTPLHYAMHYGQTEIIKFMFEHLKKLGKLDAALRLESNDGRCPMLCLLRSNNLSVDKKKDIVTTILTMHNYALSNEAKKEAKNREMEGVLKKFKQI